MARIGSIFFDLPGEGGQSMGQTFEQIFSQLRKELEEAAGKSIMVFGKIGKAAKNSISDFVKQVNSSVNGTLRKVSGTYKRSVMSFDQLNRLVKNSGSSTVINRNAQALKSMEEAFAKLQKIGQDVNEKVLEPITQWGKEKATDTMNRLKDAFSRLVGNQKQELKDYSSVWDLLKEKTQSWAAALEPTREATAQLGQSLRDGSLDADQMVQYLRTLGQESSNAVGKLLGLGSAAKNSWNGVADVWGESEHWFARVVTNPLEQRFGTLWSYIKAQADTGWQGTKALFSDAGGFFERTFGDAWRKVGKVFSQQGEVGAQIQTGVLTGFKAAVNGLIDGVNRVVTVPFGGLNEMLGKLQGIKIGNLQPFSFLSWRATVPKIPHLAHGAVLPANKPFLAMVGDQRHGTNIEAPLSTIQEALTLALEDHTSANMAGHAATVEVLRQILQAVLGIQIGDEVIAAAYDRYRGKMSVVSGR